MEDRGETWNLEDFAGYIIIGLISRIIGAIMRLIVIGLGLVALLVTIIGGFTVIALWIAAPVGIIAMFVFGVGLLFA